MILVLLVPHPELLPHERGRAPLHHWNEKIRQNKSSTTNLRGATTSTVREGGKTEVKLNMIWCDGREKKRGGGTHTAT